MCAVFGHKNSIKAVTHVMESLIICLWLISCGITPPEPPPITENPPYEDETPSSLYKGINREARATNNPSESTATTHQLTDGPSFTTPSGGPVETLSDVPSACQDRRNATIVIKGQRFYLAGWSNVAWAIKKSDNHFHHFVTKIGDYFVFLRNQLSGGVLIAGQIYQPKTKAYNGNLVSFKFTGIYDNTFDHPLAKIATNPNGYILKYITGSQQNIRRYDVEFQFGHSGACLARYYTEQQTPFSGGEPLLVLRSIDNISFYKKRGE